MGRKTEETGSAYRIGRSPSYLARAIAARSYVMLKRRLAPLGLSPIDWRILAALQEQDGCNIAELAELTATDRSNLGRAIVHLEENGLLKRRPAPRDRRNIVVGLTTAGRKKFAAALPIVRGVNDNLLGDLDAADQEIAVRLMRRILDAAHRSPDIAS